MLEQPPDSVSIYEVSPRDGLQNEARPIRTDDKLRLIQALVDAGLKRVEVSSFVSPRWIPQLADADELIPQLSPPSDVTFSALCPNARGFERAKESGLKEIAVFLSASETHNRKNTNKPIAQSLSIFEEVVASARSAGMAVRAYISTVWGCPYEGEIDPRVSVDVTSRLLNMGCYQVSISDTIGVGTPIQTRNICKIFLEEFPVESIALHLHDTRGTALANALIGLDMGMRHFDASVAGLGGCPYAPGAAGNLATEDLVYMLHGMGIKTGVDLEALVEAGRIAEAVVGRRLPGKVHQAGVSSLRAS